MKFITKLTPEEKETLREAYMNHPWARVRQRAHAVLLNDRHYLITQLSRLFEVRHQTVSCWLNAWEVYGLVGIYDNPRSGRPKSKNNSSQARSDTENLGDQLPEKFNNINQYN